MKNSVILFELPVYICDENKYYDKWEPNKQKFIEHQIKTGDTEIGANDSFFKCYKYNYIWDYNKIIGFIKICYDFKTGDLRFDIFKQDKKVIYNAVNKMKFAKICGHNLHVYVRNNSNGEIIKLINSKLNYIKDIFFNKY